MHKLGFRVVEARKAVYIDGHDAPENIERRLNFSKFTINEIWPHCRIWVKTLTDGAEQFVSVHKLDAGNKDDGSFFYQPCANCTAVQCTVCQQRENDLLVVKASPPPIWESLEFVLACNDEATFFCNE